MSSDSDHEDSTEFSDDPSSGSEDADLIDFDADAEPELEQEQVLKEKSRLANDMLSGAMENIGRAPPRYETLRMMTVINYINIAKV